MTAAASLGSAYVPVRRCSCGGTVGPTGECEACRQKRLRGAGRAGPPSSRVHDVLRSPGRPLEPGVRTVMESRFKHDFAQVRVHADAQAAESARDIAASAYAVGDHVAFAAGRYAPGTRAGDRLLAHELAHVRQQGGRSSPGVQPRLSVGDDASPLEREAEAAADAVVAGRAPVVTGRSADGQLHRHPDDLVAYTGGQSGSLLVFKEGKLIFTGPSVSGHAGHTEWEVDVGPTPTGMYHIHPGITRSPVTKVEEGVCGAGGIGSGYQEITSTTPTECEAGPHHYCNIPCPTAAKPAQLCWTPRDCWGPKRIRIEGGADVLKPKGGKAHRDGFYLHGGNPKDPVSSGCVKSMDNDAFDAVRTLTGTGGSVRFCVGSACPPSVTSIVAARAAVESVAKAIFSAFSR